MSYPPVVEHLVQFYWDAVVLDDDLSTISQAGWRVVTLDASSWERADDAHDAFVAALSFPDYYGRNLDAFNDSFGDVLHGFADEHAGFVLAIRDFQGFAAADPSSADGFLDVLGQAHLRALISGFPSVSFVQTTEGSSLLPATRSVCVGGWNRREWMNVNRA